nr:phosphatidylinositol-glycan biosynthesis class F protein-like [Biomphalaria glabrata]
MCISAVLVNCLFMFVLTVIYSSERSENRFFFQPYSFIKSCGLLLLSSVIFHIISILYGAPVLISVEETYTFSVLMSVLVILPLCLFCGPVFDSWYDVFTSSSYLGIETVVYYTSIMSILGSWAGAAAIPLDWDRPWQAWPISCAVGAIFGYCLGLLFGAVQLPRELLNNKWKVI